jgi:hypothetical protein
VLTKVTNRALPSSQLDMSLFYRANMSVKLYFQQNWRRDVRVFQTEHLTEFRKFAKQVKQVLKLRDSEHIVLKWQGSVSISLSLLPIYFYASTKTNNCDINCLTDSDN